MEGRRCCLREVASRARQGCWRQPLQKGEGSLHYFRNLFTPITWFNSSAHPFVFLWIKVLFWYLEWTKWTGNLYRYKGSDANNIEGALKLLKCSLVFLWSWWGRIIPSSALRHFRVFLLLIFFFFFLFSECSKWMFTVPLYVIKYNLIDWNTVFKRNMSETASGILLSPN